MSNASLSCFSFCFVFLFSSSPVHHTIPGDDTGYSIFLVLRAAFTAKVNGWYTSIYCTRSSAKERIRRKGNYSNFVRNSLFLV